MDYLGLTTTDQIRSTLLVSSDDLDDDVVDGYGLDDDLGEALDNAVPTWQTLIGGADPDNAKNFRRLRLYAKYQCAAWLAQRAQNFILKKNADGSNEMQRSDKDGFAWMAPGLQASADAAMAALQADLEITPANPEPMSIISRVIPDRDPITEPRSTQA